jgi:uncharacterized membrane protein YecN with MAPEG domain
MKLAEFTAPTSLSTTATLIFLGALRAISAYAPGLLPDSWLGPFATRAGRTRIIFFMIFIHVASCVIHAQNIERSLTLGCAVGLTDAFFLLALGAVAGYALVACLVLLVF